MEHSREPEVNSDGNDWGSADAETNESAAKETRNTRARKRSLQLTLVFISAAAITGCGRLESDRGTSRDVYANLEECRADWGNPEDCEEIDEKRSATGTRSYYGPRYTSRTGSSGGYSTTTRPGSRAKGTVSSGSSASRGGFGSSSSRHSSSSSYSG
jgi:uncharacterized protein YgiB involved in biofilm formation